MKNLLKFVGVLIGLFVWIELIHLSFYLMTQPNTIMLYVGVLLLGVITIGPIFYFGDNIVKFVNNMRGVFFDKEKKE